MARPIVNKVVKITKAEACTSFDIGMSTLDQKLGRADMSMTATDTLPIRDFVKLIYSDKEFEQTRKTKAEADLAELELAEKRGEIVTIDAAIERINKVLVPLFSLLHGLPKATAPKANPSDPQTAELAIEEATNNICRQIQEQLKK